MYNGYDAKAVTSRGAKRNGIEKIGEIFDLDARDRPVVSMDSGELAQRPPRVERAGVVPGDGEHAIRLDAEHVPLRGRRRRGVPSFVYRRLPGFRERVRSLEEPKPPRGR